MDISLPLIHLGIGSAVGYAVSVGCFSASMIALGTRAPGFIASQNRLRPLFILVQALLWTACAALGAFVAADLAIGHRGRWGAAALLCLALIAVACSNASEFQLQSKWSQQTRTVILTIAGVMAGCWLGIAFANRPRRSAARPPTMQMEDTPSRNPFGLPES
jgi:hypothetical protein